MEEPRLQVPQWEKRERAFTVYEEDIPETNSVKAAVLEVICGLHLLAGVAMTLFIDLTDKWPLILLAIMYCFLAGTMFGVFASAITKDDYE